MGGIFSLPMGILPATAATNGVVGERGDMGQGKTSVLCNGIEICKLKVQMQMQYCIGKTNR